MAKKAIHPLRSQKDYDAALAEIERYFIKPPKRGTAEADRFDLLALVIEDYERKAWPIDPPNPVDAIRYRMETGGYTQSDLGRLSGSRQRASDVLGRKRVHARLRRARKRVHARLRRAMAPAGLRHWPA